MPYTVRKLPHKSCYRITNTKTKKVFARCSTKKNAESQLRLLRAMEYNKGFVFQKEKRRVPKKGARKTRKNKKGTVSP
jgi:hypothetical protein